MSGGGYGLPNNVQPNYGFGQPPQSQPPSSSQPQSFQSQGAWQSPQGLLGNSQANARLAMAADPRTQGQLQTNLGGNMDQVHQMNNAYQVGGDHYRPWLNALAGQGLEAPTAAMAGQWSSEGLGNIDPNGKWQWAAGKGWDNATNSVY